MKIFDCVVACAALVLCFVPHVLLGDHLHTKSFTIALVNATDKPVSFNEKIAGMSTHSKPYTSAEGDSKFVDDSIDLIRFSPSHSMRTNHKMQTIVGPYCHLEFRCQVALGTGSSFRSADQWPLRILSFEIPWSDEMNLARAEFDKLYFWVAEPQWSNAFGRDKSLALRQLRREGDFLAYDVSTSENGNGVYNITKPLDLKNSAEVEAYIESAKISAEPAGNEDTQEDIVQPVEAITDLE